MIPGVKDLGMRRRKVHGGGERFTLRAEYKSRLNNFDYETIRRSGPPAIHLGLLIASCDCNITTSITCVVVVSRQVAAAVKI